MELLKPYGDNLSIICTSVFSSHTTAPHAKIETIDRKLNYIVWDVNWETLMQWFPTGIPRTMLRP